MVQAKAQEYFGNKPMERGIFLNGALWGKMEARKKASEAFDKVAKELIAQGIDPMLVVNLSLNFNRDIL